MTSSVGSGRGGRPRGGGASKPGGTKGKKRGRGPRFKARRVVAVGEEGDEKRLRGGKVRKLNLLCAGSEDAIPRKAQRLFARVNSSGAADSGASQTSARPGIEPALANRTAAPRASSAARAQQGNGDSPAAGDGRGAGGKHEGVKGLQPGEDVRDLSRRLREERRKLVVETARRSTHQWEKRKAYYEKRRERLKARKRRRRGQVVEGSEDLEMNEVVDDDDNMDDETRENLSRLPMYWQEIVRNNGRPVSEKKRRRLHRMELQELRQRDGKDDDEVKFGEQAERPPELSAVRKRGRHLAGE